jgi:hypothetical protein
VFDPVDIGNSGSDQMAGHERVLAGLATI